MHLKPSNIFYSQHQISSTFGKWNRHRSTTIGETLDDLCNGRCKISEIETIKVVKKDGKWYTIDNRRLWVFHHLEAAGKCTEIPVEVIQYCPLSHSRKFSSTNGGKSVTIIKGRSPGGIWHKRLYPVTPIEEREDKPAENACIVNNQSNSEKDESPSAVNVNGPLPDVLNSKGTVSQSCITKRLPITCVSGKVASNRISRRPDIATVTANYRGISLSNDIAVANRDEWRKRMAHVWSRNSVPLRLLDSFKSKQLNTKYHGYHRYIPYNFPSKIAIQHSTSHFRYSQPFKERHEDKYSKSRKSEGFIEKYKVNVYSDSSDNDWQEDDIVMLADERKFNTDDKNEKGDSDDNKDSKEIDYEDDPWSDDTYDDTSSGPEYDELDVWESNFDEYNVYHQFSDSESSDFVSDRESSDSEDAYALENIENKEQLQEEVTVQTHGQSNYIFNDEHRLSTAQPVTSFTNSEPDVNAASDVSKVVLCTSEAFKVPNHHQTSAANSELPGISPYGSAITTSNDCTRICLPALHPKTQGDIRTAFPHIIPTLSFVEHSSDLVSRPKLSASACKTTDSPFSIGFATKARPDSSICITVPTCYVSTQSDSLMCVSTFSETSSTNLTSQFSTTNSKTNSNTISSISPLDTTTTATLSPVVAPINLSSVKGESVFEESSVDTDLSDTDDEDDEDSEDCYLSVYYTLDGASDIAIKKFGYDLFSSDSD